MPKVATILKSSEKPFAVKVYLRSNAEVDEAIELIRLAALKCSTVGSTEPSRKSLNEGEPRGNCKTGT